MQFQLLSVTTVTRLHSAVLNPDETEGLLGDKSLDGALGRVEFRIHYGLISDAYELAAMYAMVIARAHVFVDANKRTAYIAMEYILQQYGIDIPFATTDVGDMIIRVARGDVDEIELANWLRGYL